jgi:hypothetical protein
VGETEELGLEPFDVTFLAVDGTVRQFVVLATSIEAAFEFVWDEELEVGGGGVQDILTISPSSLPRALLGLE